MCGIGDCVPQPILVELEVTGGSKTVDLCKVRVPSTHLQSHGYSTNMDYMASTVAGNKQAVRWLFDQDRAENAVDAPTHRTCWLRALAANGTGDNVGENVL